MSTNIKELLSREINDEAWKAEKLIGGGFRREFFRASLAGGVLFGLSFPFGWWSALASLILSIGVFTYFRVKAKPHVDAVKRLLKMAFKEGFRAELVDSAWGSTTILSEDENVKGIPPVDFERKVNFFLWPNLKLRFVGSDKDLETAIDSSFLTIKKTKEHSTFCLIALCIWSVGLVCLFSLRWLMYGQPPTDLLPIPAIGSLFIATVGALFFWQFHERKINTAFDRFQLLSNEAKGRGLEPLIASAGFHEKIALRKEPWPGDALVPETGLTPQLLTQLEPNITKP